MNYLNNLCPLCLTHSENIAPVDTNNLNVQIFQSFIEEFLLQKEALKNICNDCLEKLKNIHTFRQKSLRNIIIFNEYVQKLTKGPNLDTSQAVTETSHDNESQIFYENLNNIEVTIEEPKLKSEIFTKNKCSSLSENQINDNENITVKIKDVTTDPWEENGIKEKCENSTHIEQVIIKSEVFDEDETEDFDEKEINRELLIKDPDKNISKCFTTKSDHQSTITTSILQNNDVDNTKKVESKEHEIRIDSDEQRYKCQICQKFFTHRRTLKRHYLIVHGDRQYSCDDCGKTFTQESVLNTHKRTHTGEKPFECDVCQKTFYEASVLKKHKRIHSDEKPFACDVCQMTFIRSDYLKIHQRVHSGEKPYSCNECGKTFSRTYNLVKHKLIHTGEKPFKCDVCEKSFSQMVHLKIHQRIHTGEKPFSCDVCQKSFNQMFHLKIHKCIDDKEKPFACDVCGKTFSQLYTLKTHRRIHNGERPWACDVCQQSFTEKGSLTRHLLIHSGEKPYMCDICHESFRLLEKLKRHRLIHSDQVASFMEHSTFQNIEMQQLYTSENDSVDNVKMETETEKII